jgi:hypothetical protein
MMIRICIYTGDEVAQSVHCLTTDWTTGWSWFDTQRRKRIFFLYPLCPDHLASYPMGTRGPYRGGKEQPRCDADHSPPPLVPRSRMSRNSTTSSTCRLPGSSRTALLYVLLTHTQCAFLQSWMHLSLPSNQPPTVYLWLGKTSYQSLPICF